MGSQRFRTFWYAYSIIHYGVSLKDLKITQATTSYFISLCKTGVWFLGLGFLNTCEQIPNQHTCDKLNQ